MENSKSYMIFTKDGKISVEGTSIIDALNNYEGEEPTCIVEKNGNLPVAGVVSNRHFIVFYTVLGIENKSFSASVSTGDGKYINYNEVVGFIAKSHSTNDFKISITNVVEVSLSDLDIWGE